MSKIDKDITATVTNAPDLQQGHPPAPVAPAAPAPKPRAKKAAAKVAAPKLLANLPKPTLETVALDKIQDRRDTRRADETANAFNGSYLASKTYFGCDLPPLTLNRVEGELSVVDGQRRLQALRDCEATECEAWIYDGLSDQQVRVLTQILNLNRLDLDALDKALLI